MLLELLGSAAISHIQYLLKQRSKRKSETISSCGQWTGLKLQSDPHVGIMFGLIFLPLLDILSGVLRRSHLIEELNYRINICSFWIKCSSSQLKLPGLLDQEGFTI